MLLLRDFIFYRISFEAPYSLLSQIVSDLGFVFYMLGVLFLSLCPDKRLDRSKVGDGTPRLAHGFRGISGHRDREDLTGSSSCHAGGRPSYGGEPRSRDSVRNQKQA